MSNYIERQADGDLIFNMDAYSAFVYAIVDNVKSLSELAWLREQMNIVTNATFGEFLSKGLPLETVDTPEDNEAYIE